MQVQKFLHIITQQKSLKKFNWLSFNMFLLCRLSPTQKLLVSFAVSHSGQHLGGGDMALLYQKHDA
jgi:hypothetical protein